MLYVSSVGMDLGTGQGAGELGGSILALRGLGARGRPEPRMRLA